jgi:seryl-tRNA synthetase
MALSGPAGYCFADGEAEKIESTRHAMEKWVETRRIISQEKRDLKLSKEMLNERIELVQQEIDNLQGKIEEAEESIAEADKKREDMIEENEKLKQASSSLFGITNSLENQLKELLGRIPDPIRERVKPLSQRLPDDQKETKLSVAQRFQNVVGILNEVDKFNREVSAHSEVRSLSNGSSVEVTAMYLGIGQGYYSSADGSVAGIGSAGEDQWQWQENNTVGEQIKETISILKNEKAATFVQLPAQIK